MAVELKLDEIVELDPKTLTNEQKAFLEENKDNLTPEQAEKFGLQQEPPETPPAPEPPPKPNYKEKFKHSANENRVLREQNQVLKERIAQVEVTDPTTEQLKTEFPEWDDMTATEQKLARKTYIADKRAEEVQKIVSEVKEETDWNSQLDKFLEEAELKEQYPEITENKQEFIKFATKKTHRGVPISILADAFMTRVGKTTPEPKRTNLMSRGGGSQPPTPKKEALTPAQIKTLRETDSRKYTELVRKGVISKALSAEE